MTQIISAPVGFGGVAPRPASRDEFPHRLHTSAGVHAGGKDRFVFTVDASGALGLVDVERGRCEAFIPGVAGHPRRGPGSRERLAELLLDVGRGALALRYEGTHDRTFNRVRVWDLFGGGVDGSGRRRRRRGRARVRAAFDVPPRERARLPGVVSSVGLRRRRENFHGGPLRAREWGLDAARRALRHRERGALAERVQSDREEAFCWEGGDWDGGRGRGVGRGGGEGVADGRGGGGSRVGRRRLRRRRRVSRAARPVSTHAARAGRRRSVFRQRRANDARGGGRGRRGDNFGSSRRIRSKRFGGFGGARPRLSARWRSRRARRRCTRWRPREAATRATGTGAISRLFARSTRPFIRSTSRRWLRFTRRRAPTFAPRLDRSFLTPVTPVRAAPRTRCPRSSARRLPRRSVSARRPRGSRRGARSRTLSTTPGSRFSATRRRRLFPARAPGMPGRVRRRGGVPRKPPPGTHPTLHALVVPALLELMRSCERVSLAGAAASMLGEGVERIGWGIGEPGGRFLEETLREACDTAEALANPSGIEPRGTSPSPRPSVTGVTGVTSPRMKGRSPRASADWTDRRSPRSPGSPVGSSRSPSSGGAARNGPAGIPSAPRRHPVGTPAERATARDAIDSLLFAAARSNPASFAKFLSARIQTAPPTSSSHVVALAALARVARESPHPRESSRPTSMP